MSDALTYLMGNRWTKDAEGEFITVEDSYAVPPVSLSVEGKSTQVTTTGKNLLSDDMADWPTRNISGANRPTFLMPVESGETYTYHRNATGAIGIIAHWYNEDTEEKALAGVGTWTNHATQTITNDGGWTHLSLACTGITTMLLRYREAQLEVGSSATPYEQYSKGKPSPSPDWPQPILSVDELGLEIHGKQLMDWEHPFKTGSFYYDENTGSRFYPSSDSGVSTQIDGDNLVISIGAGWKGAVYRTPNLPSGTKCYVKIPNGVHSGSGSQYGSNIYVVDKDNVVTRRISHKASLAVGSYAITLAEGEAAFVFTVGFRSSTTGTITFEKPQIELGSTATEYAPYIGTTVPNLLPDGYSLRSLPNGIKDELHLTYLRPSDRPGWAWYDRKLVKRVDLTILDGSESYGSEGGRYYVRQNNMKRLDDYSQSLLCDYLKPYPRQSYIGGVVYFVSGISGYYHATAYAGQNWFYVAIEKDMTASDTKQWVSEHHISVQYPLATPETTSLDPIELPAMQSGLTNVWSDPSTNLSITYERDRNIVISNLKASIDDLATS